MNILYTLRAIRKWVATEYHPVKLLSMGAFLIFFAVITSACSRAAQPTPQPGDQSSQTEAPVLPTATPSPSPEPPRQLTICMPDEPTSLFLYGDSSQSASAIRQAFMDDPLDWQDGLLSATILEKVPSLADGDISLAQVQVFPNDLIIDSQGNLTNLVEGVLYLPSGCTTSTCALSYTGQEPVSMDQMVVRFGLRHDLRWSDGTPLTADDSLFSYEIGRALSPQARAELLAVTQSYLATDSTHLEWRGLPGLRDAQAAGNFFNPLPRHHLGELSSSQLLTDEKSTRSPLGWGAYQIVSWQSGDQIVLERNPNYFRAAEGLPYFDTLVFRFIPNADQAVTALQAGECDLLDPAFDLDPSTPPVKSLLDAGQAAAIEIPGQSWEHLDFGVNSAVNDPARPPFFQSAAVRQAVAQCLDRQALVDAFAPGQPILDSYVLPANPYYNPEVKKYPYDPAAANALLQSSGWLDTDNDPATARLSFGAPGVPDGTPFVVTMLTSDTPERQLLAQAIQKDLAQCGIQVQIFSGPDDQVFAPGPGGAVFGRQFSLAQFAWPMSPWPACSLYTTREIPGGYPQSPRSWGGANASGYSSPQFDQACQSAQIALPGTSEVIQAHQQAQAIFADELPALPLFARSRWVIARPDLCGFNSGSSLTNFYHNLENFNYGSDCR